MSLINFTDLQAGHNVKITGKFREGAGFLAVEISLEPALKDSEIECPIQSVDRRRKVLRLCDQEILIADGLEIKDEEGASLNAVALEAGDMIKLKGGHTPATGFVPKKIKLRETREFYIEQVQGVIAKIDHERKIFWVNGIKILVSPKTVIEPGETPEEAREALTPYIPI